jgi:hypothetical protein
MKQLIAAVGILLASWLTAHSQVPAAKSHNLSLRGVAVPSSARGTLTLVGKSEGPLAGSFEISIWYNPVTNEITGGTWKLMVPQQGHDKASKAQGALAGSIKGGTVTLDKHGRVNSIEGIQISIRRSVGQFSGVAKGSGKFSGTLDLRRQHPFKGELHLLFNS